MLRAALLIALLLPLAAAAQQPAPGQPTAPPAANSPRPNPATSPRPNPATSPRPNPANPPTRPATRQAPTPPAPAVLTAQDFVQHVRLGDSVAALVGPWKFHTGDDPAWAQPGFDDSNWRTMDLTPPPDPSDPTQTLPSPGWTDRGYPNYSGYAWYRLQVDVQDAGRRLSLKMPDSVDDAYQVFVNGVQIGQFGRFSGNHVTAYGTLPRAFLLPKNLRNGRISIAIRLWMDSATPFNSPDAGGLHGPPMLGYAADVAAEVRLDFDAIAHAVGSGFLESQILFMALLMAVALYWLDPHEDAYLWLALVCLATLLGNSVVLLANFTTPMGQTEGVIIADDFAMPVRIGLWVLFWAYWFHLPNKARLHYAVWTLVGLLVIATAMIRPPLYGQIIPVAAASVLSPLRLVVKLGLGVLLGIVAYSGFRREKAEGGMAGAAVMLAFAANFQRELLLIHIGASLTIFGFAVSLGTISTILSLLIITVMLLRRFVYSQRLQEQWKLEIEQARSIQHVLIPDKLPAIQGLTIRSEYIPAREVGGDFFQILPLGTAGSALILVGDVEGKGLQAGMLVALIVGAIRTAVQQTTDPGQILRIVNDELAEREHASATCVILRIAEDGTVALSHAGHLPPYINGHEVSLEGALPLGMVSGITFPSDTVQLHPGDELTLLSDGVVEAQDAQGDLFGFERVHHMIQRSATAAEIASAARRFGQMDDITVLQVQFRGNTAAVGLHAEPQLAVQ